MITYLPIQNQHTYDSVDFPTAISNDNNDSNLDAAITWLKENKKTIEERLALCGAVLFRGFPIHDAETFDKFSAAFDYPSFTYKESLSNAVRINFTERVFTANEAPKDVEIHLHHEMAQTPISPEKIFFFCVSSADNGGATPLCRSDQLFAAFEAEAPSLAKDFEEKGVKYTTHMPAADNHGSGQGRSWASTLSAETKEEAEQKLKQLGYSWEWEADDSLKAITPVLPAVIELDDGRKVFYNQLLAAYLGWSGVRENPTKAICFGDGSAIPKAALETMAELSEKFTFDMNWQDGDMVLVDNKTTMHGRRPYSGERKRQVLVALAGAA